MKNTLIATVLSLSSFAACAAEVTPYDLLENARSTADCKAYAELMVQIAPHNDVYIDGKVPRARAMRECREVVAARDTALRTAKRD